MRIWGSLILWHPDRIPVVKIDTPVQQTDIAPTILGLLGITAQNTQFEGENMHALIKGDLQEDPARHVFLINNEYESTAVLDLKAGKKVINNVVVDIIDLLKPEERTQELPLEFTDSIIENNYEYRILKDHHLLKFAYNGKILLGKRVVKVVMVFMSLKAAGYFDATIMDIKPEGNAFSFEYILPRYR